jgi:hypothetical protein
MVLLAFRRAAIAARWPYLEIANCAATDASHRARALARNHPIPEEIAGVRLFWAIPSGTVRSNAL